MEESVEDLKIYSCLVRIQRNRPYVTASIAALDEIEAKEICKKKLEIDDNDDFLEFYPTEINSVIGTNNRKYDITLS